MEDPEILTQRLEAAYTELVQGRNNYHPEFPSHLGTLQEAARDLVTLKPRGLLEGGYLPLTKWLGRCIDDGLTSLGASWMNPPFFGQLVEAWRAEKRLRLDRLTESLMPWSMMISRQEGSLRPEGELHPIALMNGPHPRMI